MEVTYVKRTFYFAFWYSVLSPQYATAGFLGKGYQKHSSSWI